MVMRLDQIAPLGRSLDEYRHLFALTAADLDGSILGVGDGPASFNAEMWARNRRIVSIDPLYALHASDIEARFCAVADSIVAQMEAAPQNWSWSYHASPAELKAARLATVRRFAADFATARASGRYVAGGLPDLPFPPRSFQLALCSHLLFLYSDHLSFEFHLASLLEMLRVAAEVRVFPLLTLSQEQSPHLKPLREVLSRAGFTARIERVNYELQRGGNEMLRVRRAG